MRKSDRGKGQKGVGKDRENEKGREKENVCGLCEYVCANVYVCVKLCGYVCVYVGGKK